ncbi:indoleamine 2,3-dioxygenase [Thozetella sp. PMI_491]|nr:indoleamine 2,3-dioxygenase [Thozetella sp. PMI_491]
MDSLDAFPLLCSDSIDKRLLVDGAVTINGFLPATQPLTVLRDQYYAPWESLIRLLPLLIQSGSLRKDIDELPVLITDKLRDGEEWRRAYVILAFFGSAYTWAGETAAEILPASVAVPLLEVANRLELPPIATASCGFTDLDTLDAIHTFSGTRDEAWLYVVSVAMEAEGSRLVHQLLRQSKAIISSDNAAIIDFLTATEAYIKRLGSLLERMYERCDPKIFYFGFRPFLAGGMNMAAAGLPNGVFYSDGYGGGCWQSLRGGSNGQSPIVQFLDIVLGIEHRSHGDHAAQLEYGEQRHLGFHEEVRGYMTGPHRRFLQSVAEHVRIREVAMMPSGSARHDELRRVYQCAVKALTEFRNKHLQIVARYIVLPSKMQDPSGGNRANLSVPSQPETELTGAGGTALMPFLKKSRDETFEAAQLSVQSCK